MRVFLFISRICLCLLFFLSCQKEEIEWKLLDTLDVSQEIADSLQSQIRIAIIGDSISTFGDFSPSSTKGYDGARYKSYYPRGDVRKVNNTWWYKVAESLGVDLNHVSNCSWSGSRVTGNSSSKMDASAGCSSRRIADLSYKGNPDFIICFISCNDWANNIPLGNWATTDSIPKDGVISTMREAYALMIYKAKESYPESTIICLTNLDDTKRDKTPGWPSNNTKGISVEEWNKNIKEISSSFGCYTIDLQDAGIDYHNVPLLTVDNGLHPNDAGMSLIADKVSKEIKTILSNTEVGNGCSN